MLLTDSTNMEIHINMYIHEPIRTEIHSPGGEEN